MGLRGPGFGEGSGSVGQVALAVECHLAFLVLISMEISLGRRSEGVSEAGAPVAVTSSRRFERQLEVVALCACAASESGVLGG